MRRPAKPQRRAAARSCLTASSVDKWGVTRNCLHLCRLASAFPRRSGRSPGCSPLGGAESATCCSPSQLGQRPLRRPLSGVAATLLGGSIVLGVFVTSPGSPAQWLLLGVFLAVGTCLSYLTEAPAGGAAVILERASDHRRLEDELAEARAREDALRQSEERLREAGRLKDDFLATVAHELSRPSGPAGGAHILREEKVERRPRPRMSTRSCAMQVQTPSYRTAGQLRSWPGQAVEIDGRAGAVIRAARDRRPASDATGHAHSNWTRGLPVTATHRCSRSL